MSKTRIINDTDPGIAANPASIHPQKWKKHNRLRDGRILLIEDPQDRLQITALILRQNGLNHITTAASQPTIQQALQLSQKNSKTNFDLIIINTTTPDVDALNLCRELSQDEHYSNIPLLMVTPRLACHEGMIPDALDAGAMDVMQTPLSADEIIPRIFSLLTLKQERRARERQKKYLETELAERKIMETRLKYLVNHDDLTGLSNRRHLDSSLDTALANAAITRQTGALIYIDLDKFNVINELEGHKAGDDVLIEIANMLRIVNTRNDIITRLSSDEFAILLEHASEEETVQFANDIKQALEDLQFRINNNKYHVSASFGIAMINPMEQASSSAILARADQACHEAKLKGRNKIHIFNHEDNKFGAMRDDAYWIPRIKEALSQSLFKLVFQPVKCLKYNHIERYEALVRMKDISGELITPNHFIPVAERMGLIHDIDIWVVNKAIEILETQKAAGKTFYFNINLSSHAFRDPGLIPLVQSKLQNNTIDASQITFEITETAAVTNYELCRDMLVQLRTLGCRVALDDFGSGFNSFNHLKQLPVDYLKIDGGFISNLVNDPVDQTLVRSIAEISKKLGKKTVAEFVTSENIIELLKSYGIDYAQGYYIGKPQDLS